MAEKEGLHQRLKQAIIWLKQNKNILQLDIAEKMGMTTVGLSRGLARCKEKNDEDFVIKFHQATDEVFSLDWLLHGTGEKFTADINKSASQPAVPDSSPIDPSSIMNAALAAQMQTIETQKQTIASLIREAASKDDLIADLRARVKEKDDYIAILKARVVELQHHLSLISQRTDLEDYPFPVGVADKPQKRKNV